MCCVMELLRSVRRYEMQHCVQLTASLNNSPSSKLVFCYTYLLRWQQKVAKMSLSSRLSVCLSVCPHVNNTNRWTDFHVLVQFMRDVRTADMNTGHNMCATGAKLAECVQGREMFGASAAEATGTHFVVSFGVFQFFFRVKETSRSAQTTAVCLLHRPSLNGLRVGRDSSVGVATSYGLDGPGIESR